MSKLAAKLRELENFRVIGEFLPDDHCRRQTTGSFIRQLGCEARGVARVLDLGCGDGSSSDLFRESLPGALWHGVDIADSPEVRSRSRPSDSMQTFDGINLPYADEFFDLIYCNQVLEHVRHPDRLVADAFRVLKPGGLFVGAVSYLEPYHSYSVFNFTPYGIVAVFSEARFRVSAIRPGDDASLLILRQLFNRSGMLRFLWNHNFVHLLCDLVGAVFRLGPRERNFLKVQFSGHLFFLAHRD